MRILHFTNLTTFIITIALFASIHFIMYGMIASIFLGALQLLFGIILVVYYKDLSVKHQNYLKGYWAIVIVNITAIIIISEIDVNYFYGILIVQIIPMIIASYFVFITYQIQKKAIK